MKTDARVRYTRKVIQEAFMERLKIKSINAVTVKEICDAAGVNRATFYKHYKDCHDLLGQMEDEELEQFDRALRTNRKLGREVISAALDVLDENRLLNETLINAGIQDALANKMLRMAHDNCIEEWRRMMPKASPDEVEMVFSAVAAAIFRITVGEYGKYGREAITEFSGRLIENSIRPFTDERGGTHG